MKVLFKCTPVKDKDGRIVSSQKVGKDNTLTTEEYVTKGYGDIQGESKLEQGNDIMAPAMKDKLTPEQKKELGITEEPAVEEVTPAVEEVTPAEVAVEYNGTEYTKNESSLPQSVLIHSPDSTSQSFADCAAIARIFPSGLKFTEYTQSSCFGRVLKHRPF